MKTSHRYLIEALLLTAGVAAALAVTRAHMGRRGSIDITQFENTIHSQAGEDGILAKVFEVIRPTRRFAVEFGAGDGVMFSNVRRLFVSRGWGGLLIEGDEKRANQCKESYRGISNVRTVQAWVFPANVESLFEENDVPRDLDLLVIDVDSNDWYIWRAIHDYRPKVVMIEYNGLFPPPQKMVIGFHPLTYWSERDYHFGASIQSLYELGRRKGYDLIGTDSRGYNLFFVDRQYYGRFGLSDNSPAALYRPNNFRLSYSLEDLRRGTRPAPAPDIVMDEVRIRKKFCLDR